MEMDSISKLEFLQWALSYKYWLDCLGLSVNQRILDLEHQTSALNWTTQANTTDPKDTLGIVPDPKDPAAVSMEPVGIAAGPKDPVVVTKGRYCCNLSLYFKFEIG